MEADGTTVSISLNGEPTRIPVGLTIASLLDRLGYPRATVAVALNEDFVPRSDHETTGLEDGDRIEVLTPMQGG